MFTLGRKGFGFLGAVVLSVFGLAGCGAEAPGADAASEHSDGAVGSQSQELTGIACDWTNLVDFEPPPAPAPGDPDYTWGPPISTHLCALTRLDGLAGDLQHYAVVDRDMDVGRWFIKGKRGKMTCAPHKCFSHPSSQAVVWSNSTFWVSSAGSACSASRNMFWNDAGSVLNGVRNWKSPGGWADTGSVAFTILVNDRCATAFDAAVEGFGTSFYVGVPGTGDYTRLSTEKVVGHGLPFAEQDLLKLDEGLCFFTSAGVDLAGSTRNVHIKRVVSRNRWVLSSTGSRLPQASARCIYYAQN